MFKEDPYTFSELFTIVFVESQLMFYISLIRIDKVNFLDCEFTKSHGEIFTQVLTFCKHDPL